MIDKNRMKVVADIKDEIKVKEKKMKETRLAFKR